MVIYLKILNCMYQKFFDAMQDKDFDRDYFITNFDL